MKTIVMAVACVLVFCAAVLADVNRKDYEKIKDGMTYKEVVKIMGKEGKEEVSGGNIIGYSWIGPGNTPIIAVTFLDGKVLSKSIID